MIPGRVCSTSRSVKVLHNDTTDVFQIRPMTYLTFDLYLRFFSFYLFSSNRQHITSKLILYGNY